jgi:hypothetical protein
MPTPPDGETGPGEYTAEAVEPDGAALDAVESTEAGGEDTA